MVENQPLTGYVPTLATHLLNMFSCSYITQNIPTEQQGLLSCLLYFHDSEHSLSSVFSRVTSSPSNKGRCAGHIQYY